MEKLITLACTVISGVLVYVIYDVVKEIWIIPLQEYKVIKKKVSYTLTILAAYYANPIDLKELTLDQAKPYREAATNMRVVASELRAFIERISWLRIGIPDKNRIYEASRLLIGLSNSFFTPYGMIGRSGDQAVRNEDTVHKVRELLNLHLYEE